MGCGRTSRGSSTPTVRACSWTTGAWCRRSSTRRFAGSRSRIFGDGSQTRSFCYVSDLVEGLYRLMLSDERYPVNLGNPVEMTIREFAECVCRLTGAACAVEHHPLAAGRPEEAPSRHHQSQLISELETKGTP